MSGRGACIAAVSLLAGVAAGCGGDDHGAVAPTRAAPHRPTPYQASVAFAGCMRKHGIPHPNPDRLGNFHLTPAQERRMRQAASPHEHELAERACFHHLKGTVSTKPLSPHAIALAEKALLSLSRCMRDRGYDYFSDPVVRNLSRGRASFGFRKTDPAIMKAQRTKAFLQARTACEKRLNKKLDRIIAADRGEIPN